MNKPRIIRCGAEYFCGRYDGVFLAPPIAKGTNRHEAYAAWRVLAKLAGGIL